MDLEEFGGLEEREPKDPSSHKEGRVESYCEENVDHIVVDGYEVPNLIQSRNPRIKREPQGGCE
jgi:hypothetical protein